MHFGRLRTRNITGILKKGGSSLTSQDRYLAQKFGSLLCWGMSTFLGVDPPPANSPVNTFAPTGFDVDSWLDPILYSGQKYAILTMKHHDGFALWPTSYQVPGYQPFSVAQTTWYANNGQPDIVKLFRDGCLSRGLKPGIYFSIWDETYEARSETTAASNPNGYINMIKTQLHELHNYGDWFSIWTDGWAWNDAVGRYANIPFQEIYTYVKGLQPDIIFVENTGASVHTGTLSDIQTYEITDIPADNTVAAEEVLSISANGKWFDSAISHNDWDGVGITSLYEKIWNANNHMANFLLGVPVNKAGIIAEPFRSDVYDLAPVMDNKLLGKTVTASSSYPDIGTTGVLTDGVLTTNAQDYSNLWATADGDQNAWVEVDYGSEFAIHRVVAFNRTDGYFPRLRDIVMRIYDNNHNVVFTSAVLNANNANYGSTSDNSRGPGSVEIYPNWPDGLGGRYIRISRNASGASPNQCQLGLMEIMAD